MLLTWYVDRYGCEGLEDVDDAEKDDEPVELAGLNAGMMLRCVRRYSWTMVMLWRGVVAVRCANVQHKCSRVQELRRRAIQ